eukprot:2618482-Rhodomonas_salina.1
MLLQLVRYWHVPCCYSRCSTDACYAATLCCYGSFSTDVCYAPTAPAVSTPGPPIPPPHLQNQSLRPRTALGNLSLIHI